MRTRIRLVHTDTLSCEPIVRRMPDGNLLCVSQCGDVSEPAPGNRVFAFISRDNGDTWETPGQIYPESGEAVYCTEVMVLDSTPRIPSLASVTAIRSPSGSATTILARSGTSGW